MSSSSSSTVTASGTSSHTHTKPGGSMGSHTHHSTENNNNSSNVPAIPVDPWSSVIRPKVIAGIAFGMMNGTDMMRLSEIEICSREMYRMPSRLPAPCGVLDPRLGVSEKNSLCNTCGKGLADCSGHWGYILLELPVYHIGFLKATITTLQCICKTCSRVLLYGDDRKQLLNILRNPNTDTLRRLRIQRHITEKTKKEMCCPWCGAINGPVKKVNGATCFRIIHDRYRSDRTKDGIVDARYNFSKLFETAVDSESLMTPLVPRAVEDISPLRARDLFKAIPDADLDLLWFDKERGRPENMILTHVLVPPVPIRPSVAMDAGGGSNEDDITMKLQEIMNINTALRLALEKGATMKIVQEVWDFLQVQVATLINGELPGMPPTLKPRRPIRALAQRLKGKQGRFRGNLSGKRVDFSGRTVISPDPNLPLHCVGVPIAVAKIMTFPERVTAVNIDRLRTAVINGPEYPGAHAIRLSSGMVKNLNYGDRTKTAASLRIGDIVERHMIDDDAVLFNRQPSLHKMSIMCHRARVLPGRTFRFNECVCTPYNADFDGDEMNLHLPQTEEARAEAALLMDVRANLITSRSGEPLIAAHQDFITAAWIITQRDVLLDRDQFCQVAANLGDAGEEIQLPAPAILKPGPLWTGKQVISLLLRPNPRIHLRASFEARARNYSKKGEVMCSNDGYVVVRDGYLLSGNLDKDIIGAGSKKGLVYVLIRDNSGYTAARALLRLTKMTSRWLANWGFSIGLEDVSPSARLQEKKANGMRDGYVRANQLIEQFRLGQLPLQPGCNEEQSLEALMNGTLSRLRESMGSSCMEELPRLNPARVMATCGSKGSTLNISQMVACVGQQSVGGARIQEGFVERTLPTFPARAKDPAAKGFVANSFHSGLTATEFFFHTMGGREGLVDTAVKTADTGYMQRRMMKTLEDLCVSYEGSVRTSTGDVVQMAYGDDGLDPAYMEANGLPTDFNRALLQARFVPETSGRNANNNTHLTMNDQEFKNEDPVYLTSKEVQYLVDETISSNSFKVSMGMDTKPVSNNGNHNMNSNFDTLPASANFISTIRDFFKKEVSDSIENRMKAVGLQDLLVEPSSSSAISTVTNAVRTKSSKGKTTTEAKVDELMHHSSSSGTNVNAVNSSLPRLDESVLSSYQATKKFAALAGKNISTVNNQAKRQEAGTIVGRTTGVTAHQVVKALEIIAHKYRRAIMQPGEAVGAVAAHSLGEPATQMTLKTFHFAGVASMNVTLGVPRIKEIMNASRIISTPIIEAALENGDSEIAARIVKARIEKTTLGDIAESVSEVYGPRQAHLEIRLDLQAISALRLEGVNANHVRDALLKTPRLHLKESLIKVLSQDRLQVEVPQRKSASRLRAERARVRELARERERIVMDGGMVGTSGTSSNTATLRKATITNRNRSSSGGNNNNDDDDEDDDVEEEVPYYDDDDDDMDDDEVTALINSSGGRRTNYRSAVIAGPDNTRSDMYFTLQTLKAALPSVIVQGIPTVARAVITTDQTTNNSTVTKSKYKLLVEGYDLLRVMGTPGVRGTATTSNHVIEVEDTLGIEAARVMIQSELARTYGSYGIVVDNRHTRLLADVMTYKGTVLGITRFGIAKMKDSVLMLASFEKTPDHLFDAAVHARFDACVGVSESIIVGTPVPLGTGSFSLLYDPSVQPQSSSSRTMTNTNRSGHSSSAKSLSHHDRQPTHSEHHNRPRTGSTA